MRHLCLFPAALSCLLLFAASALASEISPERILTESDFHGGLIVTVGCGNADLMLALAKEPNVLLHGLVPDARELDEVRSRIQAAGQYGKISAVSRQGPAMPYADGMVNLLLVGEGVTLPVEEIDRVLAPLGVAWTYRDGVLSSHRKPWPSDVDEWSHARYDATGNAVSKDQRAGPPRFLQWEALPRWNRGVKTSGLVSAGGRLIYILDDSHFASNTPTWSIIARDASNGIRLWRRELPSWGGAHGGKKVGPAQINRRLVALGERVYVTFGEFAPVSVLDATTGETIRTLDETGPAEEFIVSGGILVALVNPNTQAAARRGVLDRPMRLVAVDPSTGEVLWKHDARTMLPMTLAADGKQVVYHDGKVIHSLELKTGTSRWTSPPTGQDIAIHQQWSPDQPGADKGTIFLAPQFAPTLIIYGDVVAFAGGRQLNVLSAADGRELWRSDYAATNYSVPVDLFGFGGTLWGPDAAMNLWQPLDDNIDFNAYDPATGEIVMTAKGKYGFRFQHHRCHQMKVVRNTVIASRAGIEFLDTATGDVVHHHWTRGSCYYGVLPANGRLYTPPHNCACYVRAKLTGFNAMYTDPPSRSSEIPADRRLEKGPAYDQTNIESSTPATEDWPTLRHDMARSGRASTDIGAKLRLGWKRALGGSLTSPVVAGGRVYLARSNVHTLHCLDAITGEELWRRTLDGPIDSPPTVSGGLVLCGCHDGSVYALRASDGELAWRFRACPGERMIVSRGQVESVWPVHGSVLVLDDIVYFAAGKSSYLDGGIRLYGLQLHTGRTVVQTVVSSRGPDGSEQLDEQGVDGCLSDVLSTDGEHLFMRHQVFNKAGQPLADRAKHLHASDGFTSSDTTDRLLWTYAPMFTSPHQGAFYDVRLSRLLFPSGRILVEDGETVFGYGENHFDRPRHDPGGQWALFAADKQSDVPLDMTALEYRRLVLGGKHFVKYHWYTPLPIVVRAMVRTGDVLFVAGPVGAVGDGLVSPDGLQGKTEGALLAISPDDGKVLTEYGLPSTPVFDGMIAAGGRLYLSLAGGEIVCLEANDMDTPGTLPPPQWRAAPPTVDVAQEPGLVGRWRFDEGQGKFACDASGKGHHAVVAGRWLKDESGTCLTAEGIPRAAAIADAPDLQFGGDSFTLAWWVKVDAYDARLIGKEAFPENWWVINLLDDGRAEFVLGEGRGEGQSCRSATTAPLSTDDWTHLVAVVDRQVGEVRWYLDGKLDSRCPIPKTMTKGIRAQGVDISIPSRHKPFRGKIGDLRIYRQAITDERVRELFEEKSRQ